MINNYSNIPNQNRFQGTDETINFFNNYYNAPLELKAVEFDAIIGFFTSRGFQKESAEAITVTIIKQARADGFNPMVVLDNLKKFTTIELNSVTTELLNANRFKTSFLGYGSKFTAISEVTRNIVV
jgi:hypothetical protein